MWNYMYLMVYMMYPEAKGDVPCRTDPHYTEQRCHQSGLAAVSPEPEGPGVILSIWLKKLKINQ